MGWLRFACWAVVLVGGVLLALYELFFDVWKVPTDDPMLSASIEPTLTAGDIVLVSRHGAVERSEVLRCPDPQAPGRYVIGRAIAKAGEKVALEEELVRVDSTRIPSPHACGVPAVTLRDPNTNEDVDLTCSIEDFGGVEFTVLRSPAHPEAPTRATVESGRWYLISDNRHVHLDSRDFRAVENWR